MRSTPRSATITVAVCVAILFCYSCKGMGHTLATWLGAGAGGATGAVVGGPIGAGVGGAAGAAGGSSFVPAPVEPTTNINVSNGGTVNVSGSPKSSPWWLDWRVLAGGAFLFYRRAPLMRAVRSATNPKALALNVWSALWASEKAAEASKVATQFHAMQREAKKARRPYPNRPVSPLNPETFEPKEHGA